ncbi:MAG: bacteriohemerythrin [Terracidiphilus sp.]
MLISRLKSLQQNVSGNPAPTLFVAWTSHMSVEVKLLDNDHKKLLILLSELHDGATSNCMPQILEMTFETLLQTLRAHFAHEEQLFTETAFPGAAAHEREHDHLIQRFRVLQARLRNCSDQEASLEIITLLKNCIFNHIEYSDQEYVPHLNAITAGAILTAREVQPHALPRKQAIGLRIQQGA